MNAAACRDDAPASTGPIGRSGPTPVVLVVDDAPSSLGLLCRSLEEEGYTVLIARDGPEALARLDLVTPDAILLDAVMPGISGFETCRRLKSVPAWQHVPVIFMTGLSETSHIVQGFDCGGVDYVIKPVQPREVVARLATHVRNARATRLAREAVDVAGYGVVVVDAHGRIAWRSPQAARWIETFHPEAGAALPDSWHRLLPEADAPVAGAEAPAASLTQTTPDESGLRELVVRGLGAVGIGETMLLLQVVARPAGGRGEAPSRLGSAALTPRETEVLSWLAKGKTNRDIGEILGMSPRTVNKHLEHVFEKLGVETRAAAAALASRGLDAGAG